MGSCTSQALVFAALTSLGLFACDRATQLRDTEGRVYRAICASGDCKLEQTAGTKPQSAASAPTLDGDGRFVAVCDVAPGAAATPEDCRAVTCSSAADCPAALGVSTCETGFCVQPERPVTRRDAVILCLAGTGLGREKPVQMERYALALNCGQPCTIPAACLGR